MSVKKMFNTNNPFNPSNLHALDNVLSQGVSLSGY